MNQTGRYEEEFRYISLCGKERNFVRSHDTPVVFTHARKVTEYFDNIEFTSVSWCGYLYIIIYTKNSYMYQRR